MLGMFPGVNPFNPETVRKTEAEILVPKLTLLPGEPLEPEVDPVIILESLVAAVRITVQSVLQTPIVTPHDPIEQMTLTVIVRNT
jgi:hypothetical protein